MHQAAPAPPAAGMGMMGMMGSSMMGSMAGSMIGNQMSGMMSGGSPAPAQQEAPYQEMPAQQPWTQAPQPGQVPGVDACQFPKGQFMACMQQSGQNPEPCRELFEAMKRCEAGM